MFIDNELPRALLNTMGWRISYIIYIKCLANKPRLNLRHRQSARSSDLFSLHKHHYPTSATSTVLSSALLDAHISRASIFGLETKEPLHTNFAKICLGFTTIRAFGWTAHYRTKNNNLMQDSQKPMFLPFAIQIWLQMVLDLTVTGLVLVVITIAVVLRNWGPWSPRRKSPLAHDCFWRHCWMIIGNSVVLVKIGPRKYSPTSV